MFLPIIVLCKYRPPPKLSDIAEGLNYLHSCNVIHGDLKGVCSRSGYHFRTILTHVQSSILVDEAGKARITDIGLATITRDLNSLGDAPTEHGYNVGWIAPEILEGQGTYSREADIFSFSGVAIEVRSSQTTSGGLMSDELSPPIRTKVFTGAVPFNDRSPREATLAVMNAERPPRPADQIVTDDLWILIQRCWDQEAHTRPHAFRISSGL